MAEQLSVAAVAVHEVAVVAALARGEDAVAARGERAVAVASIAVGLVAVVALLALIGLDHMVTAGTGEVAEQDDLMNVVGAAVAGNHDLSVRLDGDRSGDIVIADRRGQLAGGTKCGVEAAVR